MKQQYINQRNSGQYDLNFFYRYFREKGGDVNPQKFQTIFQQFVDLNQLVKILDIEYELTTLWDKEGNFLKVVE